MAVESIDIRLIDRCRADRANIDRSTSVRSIDRSIGVGSIGPAASLSSVGRLHLDASP